MVTNAKPRTTHLEGMRGKHLQDAGLHGENLGLEFRGLTRLNCLPVKNRNSPSPGPGLCISASAFLQGVAVR